MPLHPIKVLEHVLEEYRDHLLTEFRAKDPELRAALERAIDEPLFLAQEPFFQAHRPFKPGLPWRDLPLEPGLAKAMEQRTGQECAFLHQSQAIGNLLGPQPSPLVVTTGTGSGKTECFLLPVLQNAIEDASRFRHDGLTAILVYPMNALANDQIERIGELLEAGGFSGVVKVDKYDRGTSQKDRQRLREHPPHILLTNYMMLEYLLTRPADRDSIFANHRCRFLVLDEVHTYRGALGTNIALLVRRLRAHLGHARQDWNTAVVEDESPRRYPQLVVVGTSATIKTVDVDGGDHLEALRRRDDSVREFFAALTGAAACSIQVIGETLEETITPGVARYPASPASPVSPLRALDLSTSEAVRAAACALAGLPLDRPLAEAAASARVLWDLNRWLVARPMSLTHIVDRIRNEVEARRETDIGAVRTEAELAMVVGSALPDGAPGGLRLRAHRFLRGGWRFYRCVDPGCGRLYPMGQARCECGRQTAPLHLCRNCGADYLQFAGDQPGVPALLRPTSDPDPAQEWLLYEPSRFEGVLAVDDGDDTDQDSDSAAQPAGGTNPLPAPRAPRAPRPTQVRGRSVLDGSFDPGTLVFSQDPNAYPMRVVLAPGRGRCMCCGGTAGSRLVITPVSLGTSAAVKVVGEGLVEALAAANASKPGHDQKERLLIFADSRQDAAHQARFLEFAGRYDRMRRAVFETLSTEGALTLSRTIQRLAERAVRQRDNPHVPAQTWVSGADRQRMTAWEEAPLLDDLAVSAGYRGTLFNLGLVGADYQELAAFLSARGEWLASQMGVSVQQLTLVARALLDVMRRRAALSREVLTVHPLNPRCPEWAPAAQWERRVKQPQGFACDPAGNPLPSIDDTALPHGISRLNLWRAQGAGGRGPQTERLLRHLGGRLGGATPTAAEAVSLMELLKEGRFVVASQLYGARDGRTLLQLNAEIVELGLLDESNRMRCGVCGAAQPFRPVGSPCMHCHGNLVVWTEAEVQQSRLVRRIRQPRIVALHAGEHTAQVPTDDRLDLETRFKAPPAQSLVNVLACSPTLEMGIDVGGLDAVVLRNVPPRPDNYAQRGGRAGRRARVGLVVGYARSTPHDQYFFDKPGEMIAGEVPAPPVPLGNRDVMLRHLASVAIGLAEPGLRGRMVEYVSPAGDLKPEAIDELLAAVSMQSESAIELCREAWGEELLTAAGLSDQALRDHLATLPDRIRRVFEATARQVQELRSPLEAYAQNLQGRFRATHAGDMVARLLGLPPDRGPQGAPADADDRSAGYPLRRLAEFGLLPGYEFPSEPATLRLRGDAREEDTVSVGRRFGIAQFQPEASVYARGTRWRVVGLDRSSPWNPSVPEPTWRYRVCRGCGLRYGSGQPRCPRCHDDQVAAEHPAYDFGGFIAVRNEQPVMDEEERYAGRNLVRIQPQWNGEVVSRWQAADGWSLHLRRGETIRWVNEGFPPSPRQLQDGYPMLHPEGLGWLLCPSCGATLSIPQTTPPTRGRRRARDGGGRADPFGHAPACPLVGTPPQPAAIAAVTACSVLRLVVPVHPGVRAEDARPWGLSMGYALRIGARRQYLLDGPEIEFELEGPWTEGSGQEAITRIALSFIDPSLGGSGFLERMGNELHLVAQTAIEHLDHPGCETACYRCLKSYTNQRFHDQLSWPRAIHDLEALAHAQPVAQPLQAGDLLDPRPWLEAYVAGVGSPLELRFLRLFEAHGFHPEKQVPVSVAPGLPPISVADFAVPERHIAIYVDGAAYHLGANLRRDRFIRQRLRGGDPPWTVVELRATDLSKGEALVRRLRASGETDAEVAKP